MNTLFSRSIKPFTSRCLSIDGFLNFGMLSLHCRGANRRNRYTENPPNCMDGIREFNCACLIVSLLLALLLNTSLSFTLPCIICLVFYSCFLKKVDKQPVSETQPKHSQRRRWSWTADLKWWEVYTGFCRKRQADKDRSPRNLNN